MNKKKVLMEVFVAILVFVLSVWLFWSSGYSDVWLVRALTGFGVLTIVLVGIFAPTAFHSVEIEENAESRIEDMRNKMEKAESEMEKALEKERRAEKRKEKAEQELEQYKQLFDEKIAEKEEEIREREEILADTKAREKAREIFEERKEEWREEWEEELREEIREEEQERVDEKIQEVEEEAEEKIREMERSKEKMRDKMFEFMNVVFDDFELTDIFLDGEMTVERFAVLLEAAEDEDLRDELKKAEEVGDPDTVIKARADKILDRGFSEGLASAVKQVHSDDAENLVEELEERIDGTDKGILRAIEQGDTGSGKIADHLGVSKSTVKKRYPKLKDLALIETREGSGVKLSGKGERFVEMIGG